MIESKARFVIEFLKVGLDEIVRKQSKDITVVLTSRDKNKEEDTPAFDRREKENDFEGTGKAIRFQDTFSKPIVRAQLDSGTFERSNDLAELREQNTKLERELKLVKDQLKTLMHTFGKFQVTVSDQI